MRDRKKRNIMIASLCCLLVFMGIGYALLSQTLNINGTAKLTGSWNIYIDSITVSSKSTTANSVSSTVNEDKTGASFAVELLKPGDYVEYDIVIKNEGTINAVLRELIPNIESNNMDILLTHSIIQGQILKAESETKFTLKVRFDERATDIVKEGKTSFDIQMVYEQYDGDAESIDPSIIPVTANDCFTISDTGVITDYDYSCGTYVTVPAVVNNVTVTEISNASFTVGNVVVYMSADGDSGFYVAQSEQAYNDLYDLFGPNGEGLSEEELSQFLFMKGDLNIPDTTGMQVMKGEVTIDDFIPASTKIEYLDLSQAKGLKLINPGAFLSSDTNPSLKYLNLDGVSVDSLENVFGNIALKQLIIDTDLVKVLYDKNTSGTIEMLKIYPGSTTEIPDGSGDYTSDSNGQVTVKKVEIAEGITKVGHCVFARPYSGIAIDEELVLPESLVEVSNHAFSGAKITSLILPSKLITIGPAAFSDTLISSLVIPSSVESIGSSAFSDNTNLTSLIFEKNSKLTNIPISAFSNSALSTVDFSPLKQNVEIGTKAFAGVTNVVVDKNIDLADNVFGSSLQEIILTTDDITLPSFGEATSLAKLIIKSDTLTTIPLSTFRNSPLTTIEFLNEAGTETNSSLQIIEAYAFESAIPTTVIIPSTITRIESSAFGSMPETSTIVIRKASPEGITFINGIQNSHPWNGKAQVVYEP